MKSSKESPYISPERMLELFLGETHKGIPEQILENIPERFREKRPRKILVELKKEILRGIVKEPRKEALKKSLKESREKNAGIILKEFLKQSHQKFLKVWSNL